ncbi:MAG: thiamine pyrophosphate-dependent enzyme [Nitrospinota bacterium]|jgi:thiamine pyrophosphate-dependent acetolactate synthase large subunit-like protein|nr:thiamine pyrophosphate-dependent enzyme [Nitrospinota bacterium]
MRTEDMLKILHQYREDAIVIPGRGGNHWIKMSTKPERDLAFRGTAMGGRSSFALGLALARPDEKIILLDSEGDILMGLGALATIADKRPSNLYHFILDNECYATTGGQPVPNAKKIRYDLFAQGAGYPSSHAFDELDDFSSNIEAILNEPGPVFVSAKVEPEIVNEPIATRRRWQTRSNEQVIVDFKNALGPRAA